MIEPSQHHNLRSLGTRATTQPSCCLYTPLYHVLAVTTDSRRTRTATTYRYLTKRRTLTSHDCRVIRLSKGHSHGTTAAAQPARNEYARARIPVYGNTPRLTYVAVIAADGLYKRDVFRKWQALQLAGHTRRRLTMYMYRLPRPLRGRNDRRRTDENNGRDQEDAQPVLE